MQRIVQIEHQVRTLAFGYSLLVIGVHLWERSAGALAYGLLLLQFFAYPQLAWLRTRRARDPRAAELSNQYIDSVLLGAWTAGLGFPAWIGYGLCFSTSLNAAINRGLLGAACSLVLFSFGALAWIVPFGFHYWIGTSPLVTTLCLFGSLAYSIAVGCVVHRQTRQRAAPPVAPSVPPAGF